MFGIDSADLRSRAGHGARLTLAAAGWLILAIVIACEIAWENRRAIGRWLRGAAVAAYAAAVVAGEATYRAGIVTGRWVARISENGPLIARRLPLAIAPIAPMVGILAAMGGSAADGLAAWLGWEDATATV